MALTRIHSVDHERYKRQTRVIELLQAEIEAGNNNIKLSWTSRWLLSQATMETVLADQKKRTTSVKTTLTSVEDQDSFSKTGIWFRGKHYRTDYFTETSSDTLYVTC